MTVTDEIILRVKELGLSNGDAVMVSSDLRRLALLAAKCREKFNVNDIIDGLINIIGENGTLLIPTFNWDFRKGINFDWKNTPCMTGAIGKAALSRSDFLRTKHPIYSFAVYGRDRDLLFAMENTSSFGSDSPFGYAHQRNAKGLIIDVTFDDSLTFAHYVEEQVGVPYREMKHFTAGYINADGIIETRTYSMYMRILEMVVSRTIDPIGDDLLAAGLMNQGRVRNIPVRLFNYGDFYSFAERDILENKARKLCLHKGNIND